jgi:hypothetical protein
MILNFIYILQKNGRNINKTSLMHLNKIILKINLAQPTQGKKLMCSVPRLIEIREVVEEAGNRQADEHEETSDFFKNFV